MPIEKIKDFSSKLITFAKDVSNDERIPSRDKKIIAGLVLLIISPFDIIPDWIPIIGLLDDLIILAIVLDYFFNVIDQNILLSHYPWGMKSYAWIKNASRLITGLTPAFVKNWVWKYKPDPY
jgi:uncharacterized membrane protein YkvA (DUF1232 family)